jgi:hypothetical protein
LGPCGRPGSHPSCPYIYSLYRSMEDNQSFPKLTCPRGPFLRGARASINSNDDDTNRSRCHISYGNARACCTGGGQRASTGASPCQADGSRDGCATGGHLRIHSPLPWSRPKLRRRRPLHTWRCRQHSRGCWHGQAATDRWPPIYKKWTRPIHKWPAMQPPTMAQQLCQAHYAASRNQRVLLGTDQCLFSPNVCTNCDVDLRPQRADQYPAATLVAAPTTRDCNSSLCPDVGPGEHCSNIKTSRAAASLPYQPPGMASLVPAARCGGLAAMAILRHDIPSAMRDFVTSRAILRDGAPPSPQPPSSLAPLFRLPSPNSGGQPPAAAAPPSSPAAMPHAAATSLTATSSRAAQVSVPTSRPAPTSPTPPWAVLPSVVPVSVPPPSTAPYG